MASIWACSRAPFGIFLTICHSFVLSILSFAKLNIIPGYTFAPVFCARTFSNSEVHIVRCSSSRIWSTIEQASLARGERDWRNAWSGFLSIQDLDGDRLLLTAPLLLFLCNQRLAAIEILLDERLVLSWNSLHDLRPFIIWHLRGPC